MSPAWPDESGPAHPRTHALTHSRIHALTHSPHAPAMILHIDMDAFYASVEERERPELRGRPVVVGGSPEGRGVVAAANYAARRYGVHSAMPMARAVRLCPDAIRVPPRLALYAEVSGRIHAIFRRYTPQVEPLSLDEAFLDVGASERLFGTASAIGRRIQAEIAAEERLDASVGVAPNKFLAKIASDLRKPAGFVVVEPGTEQAFLDPLPVGRLWGVGKVTGRFFAARGIQTIGELRRLPPAMLQQALGSGGEQLRQLAHGIDPRPVVTDQEAKSISHENTFAEDVADPQLLEAWLLALTEQVAERLRRAGLEARTVQLKVRLHDFTTLTRARTLDRPTDLTRELWRTSRELFRTRLPRPLPPVRLLGMGVSGFEAEAPRQADLFAEPDRRRQGRLDAVADAVRTRFGHAAIHRGPGSTKR